LPQEQERALGGWQAEWPTLAALIETPGSAVQAMGQVAAGLEIDADALQANMRHSALAVGRRSDRLDPSDSGGNK
jgi:3-carboxy-cis,cis-muconate cycloisomerase